MMISHITMPTDLKLLIPVFPGSGAGRKIAIGAAIHFWGWESWVNNRIENKRLLREVL